MSNHQIKLHASAKWLVRDSTSDAIFGLTMAGKTHNMTAAPSIAKTALAQRSTVLNSESFLNYLMKNFFGDTGAIRNLDQTVVWKDIHGLLNNFMKESFLSRASAVTVRAIEANMVNLVSLNESLVDQSVWERASSVIANPSEGFAEASLFPLLRNFVGNIASSVLMGSAFMDNNPNVLQDLWDWDDQFITFLLGVPPWAPLPKVSRAYAARSRVIKAVADFHRAMHATAEGKDPGSGWGDMSDVSDVMAARAKLWRKSGLAPEGSAPGDGVILW